ncbi:hypothetical protein [Fibrella forsythiae]|uniref:Uncharacterized protein n=1 Tax=Fibrella forsythiae TaxID=2817061 RepID=A0ABS3JMH8_9BACT|nr:hypothetical protein [Fibrella forsythiae]MBO0951198.1 hypothetical protein [Fibrella forsythiae]
MEIILGILSLVSGVYSFFSQADENQRAKEVADATIAQKEADLAIQRANADYGVVSAELQNKALATAARKTAAEAALKQATLIKSSLMLLALIGIFGAVIMLLSNREKLAGRGPTRR